MKFTLLTAIAAAVVAVSATPAGHMNLAKRAIITTQTIIEDGTTYVEVVEDAIATTVDFTTVTNTVVATETDATYIFSYSGDDAEIISKLQAALSNIIAAEDAVESGGLVDDITSLAGNLISDVTDLVGDVVSDVTGAVGDVGDAVGDAVGA